MMLSLDEAAELAAHLASDAGELARSAFGTQLTIATKTSPLDVVTQIDHAAEKLIVEGIHERYPAHQIIAEESGTHQTSSQWTWLVDPLDGTSNFTIGLPIYGLSIALLRDKQVVLALARDSHLRRQLLLSESGAVATSGGLVVQEASSGGLSTVALQQGYGVPRDDILLAAVRERMESQFRRVLYTWSPSVDILLVASGMLGGIVSFRCTGPEHVVARALALQIGCRVELLSESRSHGTFTQVIGWSPVVDGLLRIIQTAQLSTE